ncbi:hypothetical protein [Kaistella sp.]|uniref:hypothetical protein n=1 Tax=Kaistella sp. TaxID=2782235 RepID=UPI002F92D522
MQNSLSDFSFIEANLYESLEEAHEYIDERTVGMESIDPHTVAVNYSDHVKFVETLAFIDLTTLIKYEYIISLNNSVYEVQEKKKAVILFHEYCRWGHFEEFKSELNKPGNSKYRLPGFLSAIYGDQVEIVKYFIDHSLFSVELLYNSPLYECVRMDSVKSFRFLVQQFEPQEQMLPYILEKDAFEILKYILATSALLMKMAAISPEDRYRIKRDIANPRFNNRTMQFFKENFARALALHN